MRYYYYCNVLIPRRLFRDFEIAASDLVNGHSAASVVVDFYQIQYYKTRT